jgi:hypothetical protein
MTEEYEVNPEEGKEGKEGKEESPFPYLEDLGEAGGVAFTSLRYYRYTENGETEMVEVSVTGRGRNAREAFENLGDVISYAKSKGWTAYKKVSGAPARPQIATTAVPAAVPAVPTVPALPAVPAAPKAVEPVQEEGNVITASKLVVTPRPDGKVSLAFFAEGHKWADITKVCSVEQAVAFLTPIGGFTAEHLKAVATYEPILAHITWVESDKKNAAGNPYKDIVSITAG